MVERIRVIIEKRLNFEPIRLKKKVSPDRIGALTGVMDLFRDTSFIIPLIDPIAIIIGWRLPVWYKGF